MGKQTRRKFTGAEKVAVLKRHLVNRETVSDICDDLKLNPNIFYRWQKIFFENGARAFETGSTSQKTKSERAIDDLNDKLVEKDGVISELVTELIKSKKKIGDP